VANFVHNFYQKIITSAIHEGAFGVQRSTHSFLTFVVHGYINMNYVVVVVAWRKAGGSGVR